MSETVTAEVTPPVLQGPTSKERKYDRQLRLWAANGQAALEEAHILLINTGAGVVGIEALKNLVLPGVGNFTILDSAVVKEEDLGVNFFLTDDDIGHMRAEACTKWLQELNPDVQGHANTSPIDYFISNPSQLSTYTLILATLPLPSEILEVLSQHSESTGVPIFYIQSLGFYSQFTVQLPSAFPIVETHPDPTTTTDVRLLNPWPELLQLAKEKTNGLNEMQDEEQHGHVPYLLLLLHYLEAWRSTNNGQSPQNYKDKVEIREMVRKGMRTNNLEGGEENFEEAIGAVLKSLNPSSPSSAVKEVFAASECQNLTAQSADFWLIARSISDFYNTNAILPLPGSVPDMKAKSAVYIRLQNVYKSKARADVDEVVATVRAYEKHLGKTQQIPVKEVEAFCKNAGHIKLVRGRAPLVVRPGEVVKWGERSRFAASSLTNPEALMTLHIAFLAYNSYAASHAMTDQTTENRAVPTEDYNTEVEKLTGIAHTFVDSLITEAGTFIEDPEYSEIKENVGKIVQEMARANGGELHNISAAVGGMVAQEVIKVITKQYIPVDSTCLFDGIFSKTSVLKL